MDNPKEPQDKDDKKLSFDKPRKYRRTREQIDPNVNADSPYLRDTSNHVVKGII